MVAAFVGHMFADSSTSYDRESRRERKVMAREALRQALKWSDVEISFDQDDRLENSSEPGRFPILVCPRIENWDLSRVFVNGGSSVNLIFTNTLDLMDIPRSAIMKPASPQRIYDGIIPGSYLDTVGQITLEVSFGTARNFRTERIMFDVVDVESAYHAFLGRPAIVQFMAFECFVSLCIKMPGPNGVITVRGCAQTAMQCEKESLEIVMAQQRQDENSSPKQVTDGFSTTEHNHTYDVLEKCTKDILSAIKPDEKDRNLRLQALQELKDSISSLGALTVEPFGSFLSNLYAKSGDLDVSLELLTDSNFPSTKKTRNVLKEVCEALQTKGIATDVRYISLARVPVVQYVSKRFGISCDVSVDNYLGQIKSKVLYCVNDFDKRFGHMVLLVKEWAKAQNINDPKNGTLNSYTLCLLVLYHFQTCTPAILPPMREIYDVKIREDGAKHYNERHVDAVCKWNLAKFRRQNTGQRNRNSLSHLLVTFFEKFTGSFLTSAVISTYEGRLKEIQDLPYRMTTHSLFVEDPFERHENAARAVGRSGEIGLITSAFDDASYVFANHRLANRKNELLSLLCTPEVAIKAGADVDRYAYTRTISTAFTSRTAWW